MVSEEIKPPAPPEESGGEPEQEKPAREGESPEGEQEEPACQEGPGEDTGSQEEK